MDDDEIKWVELPKYNEVYINGVKAFIRNVISKFVVGDEMMCPCKKCKNDKWYRQDIIYNHLVYNGPSSFYMKWMCEVSRLRSDGDMDCEAGIGFGNNLGDMLHHTHEMQNLENVEDEYMENSEHENRELPNDAKKFYRYLEEGKQPLYPGCLNFSRSSFIIRLYSLKCEHGITEVAFGDLLGLMREAFSQAHIPLSFNAAKNIIRDLGLDYQKIHACLNDCMLYWGENQDKDFCKACGFSRWEVLDKEANSDNCPKKVICKIPTKVMRYFPLKPRLQRLFMSKEYSQLMSWHAVGIKKGGKHRHPADAEAWQAMDARYPNFSAKYRNVRLGVAIDRFNPYRTMASNHTTWPIVLVNYNIPPWLCMKLEHLILLTLISGPESPKNNIDIFMQPLIEDMKELWDHGLETYDALTNQNFRLHASILWTISDFPGYAMLSGWSTKGKLACPVCHYETFSIYSKHSKKLCYMCHRKFLNPEHKWRLDKRRFNGEVEMGQAPLVLTGTNILEVLSGFENEFGKDPNKKKDKGGKWG